MHFAQSRREANSCNGRDARSRGIWESWGHKESRHWVIGSCHSLLDSFLVWCTVDTHFHCVKHSGHMLQELEMWLSWCGACLACMRLWVGPHILTRYIEMCLYNARGSSNTIRSSRSWSIFRIQEQPQYTRHHELINEWTADSYMVIILQKTIWNSYAAIPQAGPFMDRFLFVL